MQRRWLLSVMCGMLLLTQVSPLLAQHCHSRAEADSLLEDIRLRVSQLNNSDPELISLHYLFAGDLQKELKRFNDNELPYLYDHISASDYYALLRHYDRVSYYARNVRDTLNERRQKVDSLFYVLAVNEMMFDNRQEAEYYTDRALEYNRLNPDALLLKVNLLYDKNQYNECLDLIHLLYNEVVLDREHEMQISDFTILFYNKLYSTGDSLVKMGHSAEALEVFTTLEQFCHNMPSNYCNDDYYKGILRSKTGVFNSYLAVAEAALRRGNADMARLFWEYALQYKETNEGEILDEAALLAVEEELRRLHTSSTSAPQEPQPVEPEPRREESNAPTLREPQSVESEPRRESAPQEPQSVEPEPRSEASRESALQKERELNLECERLLVEGINYCYKEEYEKAFEVLSKAKSIGTCGGEILDKLLRSLKQILED
ncbi:MAG: hypothetical protein IKR71_04925 [Bacteroidales bacterium]|nr:hypothetical protein [Bacteroidales bacterium]